MKWVLRILHILVLIVKVPFDLLAIPSQMLQTLDEAFNESDCWK